MLVRIVRMTFQADRLSDFDTLFQTHKQLIRSFPGCLHLELHQDANDPHVRYTYSHWENQAALDAYRHSELFGKIWPDTKALFSGRPQAFSLVSMETVSPRTLPE